MTVFDWEKIGNWQAVAMPVARPKYVDDAVAELTGPNEQHHVDPSAHCTNPKCGYHFAQSEMQEIEQNGGEFTCPHCGYTDNYLDDSKSHIQDPDGSGKPVLNPGGRTRSGLTLSQMGDIGEQVVLGLGELPGIGAVEPASNQNTFPIDAIIRSERGNFGVEIKTNHSQAQERFKIGGKDERAAKIAYCMANGLKPALIGVRLNFFTDKAYVFFREGLTDTWIGNKQMITVGTYDFSHLNPFKTPDPQSQALAVENANLPDQAIGGDDWSDIDDVFGPAISKTAFEEDEHKRDDEGKFTFKEDVHELKIVDKKGKHKHTIKRCHHCGVTYQREAEHKGRIECPSCGEDPERTLKPVSRVVVGAVGENGLAQELGWGFNRYSGNGKPVYQWTDTDGYNHIVTGYGDHGKANIELAHQQTARRMQKCMAGTCGHALSEPTGTETITETGAPLFAKGTQVTTPGGGLGIVLGADGEHMLVKDYQSGKTQRVPSQNLKAAADEDSDPDYLFVYYMSELVIKEWDHNLKVTDMLQELLDKFGVDTGNAMMDIDTTKTDTGELRTSGSEIKIKHTQLSEPEVREHAEEAIKDWWRKHSNEDWEEVSEWASLSS